LCSLEGFSADVMVGFNRRFAPLTHSVKERLARWSAPVIQCRLNEGAIPDSIGPRPSSRRRLIVGEMVPFRRWPLIWPVRFRPGFMRSH
jgi:hypothetical protein